MVTKAASAQPGTRTKVEPVCPAGGGHRLSITRVRRTAGTPGARVTPSHWRADGKSGQEGAWGGAGFPARRSVPGLWPEAWELGSLGPHPAEWLAGTVGQPVRVLPLMGRPVVLNALPARPTLERHPLRTGVGGGGSRPGAGAGPAGGGGWLRAAQARPVETNALYWLPGTQEWTHSGTGAGEQGAGLAGPFFP